MSASSVQKGSQSPETLSSTKYRPKFVKLFKKTGKQGIVGVCSHEGKDVVFKISRYINYTTLHEYNVLKSLERIADFCPFFCRLDCIKNIALSPKFRNQSNPLALGNGHYFTSEILYTEIIRGKNLSSLFKNKKVDNRVILAAMRQTLAAVLIAQQEEDFTHYDLHSSNILMVPCPPNSLSLFVHQTGCIQTPTYGTIPKIIDFGFSFAKNVRKKPICSSLAHTDIGFLSHKFDSIADPKLLLISLAYEAKLYRSNDKHMQLFRKVIKRIFRALPTDSNSGWDKGYRDLSAIDQVMELTDRCRTESDIFDRYNHFSLDIMQHMISLPLRRKKSRDIRLAFSTLDKEMKTLANELGSSFFNLYIFKRLTEHAISLRNAFTNQNTRKRAVLSFKRNAYAELDKISKFCLPKINFERFLCALYVYADAIENVLHSECRQLIKEKELDYKKMERQTIPEILSYIDKYLPDKFTANTETIVSVFDSTKRIQTTFTLKSEQVREYNKLSLDKRADYLNNIHNDSYEVLEASNYEFESDESNETDLQVEVGSSVAEDTVDVESENESVNKEEEESADEEDEKEESAEEEEENEKEESAEEDEESEKEESAEEEEEEESAEEEEEEKDEEEESAEEEEESAEEEEESAEEEEESGGEEESAEEEEESGGEEESAEEKEESAEEEEEEKDEEEEESGENEESAEEENSEEESAEEEEESGGEEESAEESAEESVGEKESN